MDFATLNSSSGSRWTSCLPLSGVGVVGGEVRDQQTHTPPGLWHTLQGSEWVLWI